MQQLHQSQLWPLAQSRAVRNEINRDGLDRIVVIETVDAVIRIISSILRLLRINSSLIGNGCSLGQLSS
jgi:hypothetical protein